MTSLGPVPVFGICGFSGAGKTTLIVDLIARLRARGLATLVIKHDAHGLDLDRPGKDTHRLFAAGADVLARDPHQSLLRTHAGDTEDLAALIKRTGACYDVILVEGHKGTPLPRKVWLRRHARDRVPAGCGQVALDLGRDDDRLAAVWRFIEVEMGAQARDALTMAGVLIGGESRRMGRSKHLLRHRGRTWLEHIVAAATAACDGVVLLGRGQVPAGLAHLPRLPDVDGAAGPVAGLRAALRFQPNARWLFLACDTPLVTAESLRWLRQEAEPGVWAVLPRLTARAAREPLPGWYAPQCADLLEGARGPSDLANHPKARSPVVPPALATAWLNCNTPADRARLAARARVRR
jgi:molybdopterin-guanine dinucleotide biosynthesis protein A